MNSIFTRLLLCLAMIEMAVSAKIEGQTKQYVKIKETQSGEPEGNTLTCSAYSVRAAGELTRYTKYMATQEQFSAATNWTDRSDAENFTECARVASESGSNMFLWDEGCQTSMELFHRLPEPCPADDATVVYMLPDQPESSCANEYFVIWDGNSKNGSICQAPGTSEVFCKKGVLYSFHHENSKTYFLKTDERCYFSTYNEAGIDLSDDQCNVKVAGSTTCAPETQDTIPDFLQSVKDLIVFGNSEDHLHVGCQYISPSDATPTWSNDVVHPDDSVGGWKDQYPKDDKATNKYCYLTPDGLINEKGFSDFYDCCQFDV